MFRNKVFSATAAMCIASAMGVGVQASELGRRYLAVDQSLHGNLSHAQMVMGQATDNATPVLQLDQSWELVNDLTIGYVSSVIKGHDGTYRMYYELRNIGSNNVTATAVAESLDGINWTKPAIGANSSQYINTASSNIVNLSSHSAMEHNMHYQSGMVYYDANAPTSQRYKMGWLGSDGAYITTSSDGRNFTNHLHSAGSPAWDFKRDTGHSFFYDEIDNVWRMYGRERNGWPTNTIAYYNRRGAVMHSNNTAAGSWSNVGQAVMDPIDYWDYEAGYNAGDPPSSTGFYPDIYTPSAQTYHGQYIALPSVFHRDSSRDVPTRPEATYWMGTGPIYPMVAHSLDGENWTIPDPQSPDHPLHSIIDQTPHLRVSQASTSTSSALEVGQIYSAGTPILDLGDELLIYYVHRWTTHYEGDPSVYPGTGHTIHAARLRADGFASIKADEGKEGEWRTTTVDVPNAAKGLLVNAKVDGSLKVAVLDAGGTPIANLTLTDSVAFQGDETSAFMQWESGQFKDVAGQEVQLLFVVEDGEIYSFSFTAIPEPASLTLMGVAALALLRRRQHD